MLLFSTYSTQALLYSYFNKNLIFYALNVWFFSLCCWNKVSNIMLLNPDWWKASVWYGFPHFYTRAVLGFTHPSLLGWRPTASALQAPPEHLRSLSRLSGNSYTPHEGQLVFDLILFHHQVRGKSTSRRPSWESLSRSCLVEGHLCNLDKQPKPAGMIAIL